MPSLSGAIMKNTKRTQRVETPSRSDAATSSHRPTPASTKTNPKRTQIGPRWSAQGAAAPSPLSLTPLRRSVVRGSAKRSRLRPPPQGGKIVEVDCSADRRFR